MSKNRLVFVALLPLTVLAAAALVAVGTGAAPSPEAARLDVYAEANGPTYFALSLRPAEVIAPADRHDVVVLVNTSVAQTGAYRTQTLDAVKSLLGSLGPNDRVQLIAYDLNASKLTGEFIAPKGPEADAALAKLEKREPLGASDLEKALSAAIAAFGSDAGPARALVCIGDGSSRANIISPEKFGVLVGELAAKKIPVTGYGVGLRVDEQVLGALAGQTGGIVVDGSKVAAADAGKALAAAANAAVLWPIQATFPAGMKEILPKQAPPLRYDRDTVVIGTLQGAGPLDLQMTVDTPAGKKTLSWKVPQAASKAENAYLAKLVALARPAGGVTMPIVGSASLAQASQVSASWSSDLATLSVQALASGDKRNAERLAREALARDPNNDKAETVLAAVQKAASADLNLAGPPVPSADTEDSALANEENRRNLIAKQVTTAVEAMINGSRERMAENPELALQDLKLQLESVKRVAELEPGKRDQLKNQLEAAIRDGERRKVEIENRRQAERANLAASRERTETLNALERRQRKVEQLMLRFDALMQEGKYKIAEEQVAAEARKIDPANTAPIAGEMMAKTQFYLTENLRLREDRQKKVVDTLFEVEKSYMPFPAEPPIVYPDADVWRQLTERRKEFAAMNLLKSGRNKSEARIIKALDQPTKILVNDLPLDQVIEYIADYHKDPDGSNLPIQLDRKALADANVSTDQTITRNLSGISLRSALKLLLKEFELTYMIDNEVLMITTQAAATERLVTKVYPVADLVMPTSMGMGGMGGMGGGMMGGMGGMGGGMMGGMGGGMGGMGGGMGGMGGGMGGMGGMGGGMGGMGMMNLPPALQNLMQRPNMNGGFRAFSVNDDLSLSAESVATAKSEGEKRAPEAADAKAIRLNVAKGADVNAAWDAYFAKNTPSRADVRQTVRELWKARRHDQVIALVKAALRHKQDQPWMYEALALSLQKGNHPKEEIERAVMSAVEFAQTSLDLLVIGAYLEQLDLQKRALQVYRQVAQMDPMLPEAYVQGLRVAQELDDLDGIQWATVGVLSQAWSKKHQDVWEKSRRVAEATLDNLKRLGKSEAAKKYEAALDAAVARDVALVVSWTGEGDVDVVVREPSGTVCSVRSQRTVSGGAMLGDLKAQVGKENTGAKSEIYVCPKSFNGTYNLAIRRIWGQVTAGRVKVDVCTHFRTRDQKIISQTIPLKDDQALVRFELTGGRRIEPIQDRQLAVAAANQLAVRQQVGQIAMQQQVLAQQLGGADPAAAGRRYTSLSGSGGTGGGGGGTVANPFAPFLRSGAVGYQPVIQMLPEGGMMSAFAVVSADRRYVRVSPQPYFSAITEVNTFNFATGQGGTGQGGGQGGFGQGGGGGGFGGGGGGGGGGFF